MGNPQQPTAIAGLAMDIQALVNGELGTGQVQMNEALAAVEGVLAELISRVPHSNRDRVLAIHIAKFESYVNGWVEVRRQQGIDL